MSATNKPQQQNSWFSQIQQSFWQKYCNEKMVWINRAKWKSCNVFLQLLKRKKSPSRLKLRMESPNCALTVMKKQPKAGVPIQGLWISNALAWIEKVYNKKKQSFENKLLQWRLWQVSKAFEKSLWMTLKIRRRVRAEPLIENRRVTRLDSSLLMKSVLLSS